MKNNAYKVIMSKGDPIPVDRDEISDIISAIQTGSPCIVRQGIFNPSFWVSIVLDDKRYTDWLEDTKHSKNERIKGIPKLDSIFERVDMIADGKKLLGD